MSQRLAYPDGQKSVEPRGSHLQSPILQIVATIEDSETKPVVMSFIIPLCSSSISSIVILDRSLKFLARTLIALPNVSPNLKKQRREKN